VDVEKGKLNVRTASVPVLTVGYKWLAMQYKEHLLYPTSICGCNPIVASRSDNVDK
jgi:hypothetical protein